jgi:poly [ADP-ribose] polymerase
MLDQNAKAGHERNSNLFKRAVRVKNNDTESAYEKFMGKIKNKKKELLWHGSRNENWWSIFQQGLVLRPTNAVITGKMFGYGLYFADKAQKSINYSSYSGASRSYTGGSSRNAILAIYEVHQGDQMIIKRHDHSHSQLTDDKMIKHGKDSVFAQGGYDLVNNEYIVYKQQQCTIKYLVEIGN